MTWRAWYAVGRREWVAYSSAGHTWQQLPPAGMVGVVIYETPPYRRVRDGGDWYWLEDGDIHASGTVWDGYVDPPAVACASCVKRSGVMDDDAWAEVQLEMIEARAWP